MSGKSMNKRLQVLVVNVLALLSYLGLSIYMAIKLYSTEGLLVAFGFVLVVSFFFKFVASPLLVRLVRKQLIAEKAAMSNRAELEQMAKDACPAELWYDLVDTLEETPDEDLISLIKSNS